MATTSFPRVNCVFLLLYYVCQHPITSSPGSTASASTPSRLRPGQLHLPTPHHVFARVNCICQHPITSSPGSTASANTHHVFARVNCICQHPITSSPGSTASASTPSRLPPGQLHLPAPHHVFPRLVRGIQK
jgi:hypothetical protein